MMSEFFHMGGYAAYVWPAYGIATLVLLGLLAATWKGLRNAEATLKALESARPARRRTRNGPNNELNNDHVFRNRAPILMAQVDPDRLCVIRETERVIIPNTGARLGNFGITPVSENEVWVVETEWMQNTGPSARLMLEMLRERMPEEEVERLRQTPYMCGVIEQFGADNRVWAARLLF